MSEQAMDTLPAIVVPALDQRDPFCPSEYTGLLMHALRDREQCFAKGKGLDMGLAVECCWARSVCLVCASCMEWT